MAGIELIEQDLPSDVFDRPYNEGLIHQAVVAYQNNQRVDLAKTKSRSEVSGSNKKPWPQKGTGRSRHGSRISPLWVGGGRAHGPDGQQNHQQRLTKKMKRGALTSALSERYREGRLYRLDPPELEEPSTSTMHEFFMENGFEEEKILLCLTPDERTLRLSTRNLPYCQPFDARSLTTFQVVAYPLLLFTEDGLETLVGRFQNGN